jgi:ATP-binding protein involved in chromosome partitioning
MKQGAYQGLHYVKPSPEKPVAADRNKSRLPQVRSIVAVASGKGGVGKSTVAVNLAVALSQQGFKVGLMDADVYGPSIPKMTGTEQERPPIQVIAGVEKIIPIERHGVKWMSIGYFSASERPLIWRGPMATNALRQLLNQVEWGALDVLLIDLPPGTGDIHVSMVQEVKLSGAVVVSTPQAVALTDVEKGVHLFLNEKVNVPVLGLIENMAWFTPEELPGNKYYIFGKEGAVRLAEKLHLPLLAQLPIVQGIRESGDEGTPIALKENAAGKAFLELAGKVAAALHL